MEKLALLGGKPSFFLPPPVWPRASKEERKYLENVLNSGGWGIFRGSTVYTFADKFASYHGAKYGIPCANATAALRVQLESLRITRGDEVITTIFTCVSTASAITELGAIPIFVDVQATDYCIDVQKIREKITKKTKAIIAVHLYNSICDLERLVALCDEYGIFLIEDAAQVPGSFYKGKGVGTFGVSGSFSFQEAKVMTSGEGGIIITNSQELFEVASAYINCGRRRMEDQTMRRVMGHNLRMTNLQGAILLGQLELLAERTRKREESVKYLNENLRKVRSVYPIERRSDVDVQACYYYLFRIDPEQLGLTKALFERALEAEGVVTRKVFVPLYRDPLFNINEFDCPEAYNYYSKSPLVSECFPIAERATEEAVALWHPILLEEKTYLDGVILAIQKVVEHAHILREKFKTI